MDIEGGTITVCVCTPYEGVQEPRAPRHAAAIAKQYPAAKVFFVDCAPGGAARRPVKAFENLPNLVWQTHYFSTRAGGPFRLARDRAGAGLARFWFKLSGAVVPAALSSRVIGMERTLREIKADIYLAHNIETLLPAYRAASQRGALVMFDSMEFHSDMGESQTALERELVRAVEKICLPKCALVLASSPQLADALATEYRIDRPLPLNNTPPVAQELPAKAAGFNLYWRNAVVGLGQRGLDDALVALTNLPVEISLHLQGRMPADGGAALKTRIAELNLTSRVVFHPPYAPEDAVKEAARHTVGLCLERKVNRNHDLTVSNKIFDYHMAGLAVIASDLPGLRGVMEASKGGLLFTPGSIEDLTAKILMLYRDPVQLGRFAQNARAFALRDGNLEKEMKVFIRVFERVCREKLPGVFK